MSEQPEIRVRREGGAGVIEAEGYLNNIRGKQVAAACYNLLAEGVGDLVLNLALCSMVNSIGVSFLIEAIEEVDAQEGRVVFCCVAPMIERTLQIMGLLQTVTLYDTEAEALQALAG